MARARSAIAVVLALVASAPIQSRAADVVPMARHTVIYAHGNAGIRLQLPRGVTLDRGESSVEVVSGTIAAAGLAMGEPTDWSYWRGVETHIPGTGHTGEDLPKVDPASFRGIIDLYILTDGVARVEFDIEELDGAAEYTAVSAIEGTAAILPNRCTDDRSCAVASFGGMSRTVASPGFVASYKFRRSPALGTSLMDCQYPDAYGYDASERAHPDGCDTVAQHDAWSVVVQETAFSAAELVPTVTGGSEGRYFWGARGAWYLGYRGYHPMQPASIGAAGVWLSPGIS